MLALRWSTAWSAWSSRYRLLQLLRDRL